MLRNTICIGLIFLTSGCNKEVSRPTNMAELNQEYRKLFVNMKPGLYTYSSNIEKFTFPPGERSNAIRSAADHPDGTPLGCISADKFGELTSNFGSIDDSQCVLKTSIVYTDSFEADYTCMLPIARIDQRQRTEISPDVIKSSFIVKSYSDKFTDMNGEITSISEFKRTGDCQ